jgi:hypothetical protein
MKIESVKNSFLANNTSFIGTIDLTYNQIKNSLGEPLNGDNDKVTTEWIVLFENDVVATIYDWKENQSPKKEPDVIYSWHIGGRNGKVLDLITSWAESIKE